MLGGENTNFFERKLAKIINGSASHNDIEAFSHPRGNSSQETEIRDINNEDEVTWHDRFSRNGLFNEYDALAV